MHIGLSRGPELAKETVKLYEDLNKTTDPDLIIGGSKIIEQCWDIISEWLITRILANLTVIHF